MLFQKWILFILFFVNIALYGEPPYILCIDGGGSKTALQIVDQKGQLMTFFNNEIKTDKIETSGSNINVVGIEGVRVVLQSLIENIKIGEDASYLMKILPKCQVVAGMAGVGLIENKQKVVSLFEEWGINKDRIIVMSDAELALHLIDDKGIVLIAGTGSICHGKEDQNLFRVGGLGRILGDEGSGYQIGLQAFKAALADEYGWGIPTNLTLGLKELFKVTELKSLIPQINQSNFSPSKIASIAPLVFKMAWEKDVVADEIINGAARDLGHLLTTQLQISHLRDCEVHLWGGIFKSRFADDFIQKMMDSVAVEHDSLKIINYSHHNVAVLFVLKKSTTNVQGMDTK